MVGARGVDIEVVGGVNLQGTWDTYGAALCSVAMVRFEKFERGE